MGSPLSSLSKFAPAVYALMRIVVGFLFAVHGAQKLFGVLGGEVQTFLTQAWFGGVIELVTGVLIAIGLFTRPAAFLASGTMAVAYAQFHWKFAMGDRFFPAVNGGELAAVYAFLFLYIACAGAGRFSADGRGR